jgi:acetoin utilization deacetylase AcuC-like enzyme
MTTLIFTHPACVEHDPGAFHPECPARLKAVLDALKTEEFKDLQWRDAPRAETDQLTRVHPRDHVDRVLSLVPKEGHYSLDPDTVLSPSSGEAALRAAGALCAAVDAVVAGEGQNAFCAVRPPGHHAEAARAMGFCLFNNVAVGALHAREQHGLARAAVIDFDVHHGNGTQATFAHDAELFYASTHQFPHYPGTGSADEQGVGNVVNAPLAPNTGSVEFRQAMNDRILPALRDFAPDFTFISAGFDAHAADPLAQLNLVEEDFAWATREIMDIAEASSKGRVVSTLEGGYDLDALGSSAAAHVRVLMSG